MISYDKIIMLIYFNTYRDTYNFITIKDYLGFSFPQLDEFINEMISEELLQYDQEYILSISEKGISFLEKINLKNVNFEDLLVNYTENMIKDIGTGIKLRVDEVYLPKNFDKKFNGYNKKVK